MKYGKLFSILAIACLLSFTGCQTESAPSSKQEKPSLTSSPSTTNDTSAQPKLPKHLCRKQNKAFSRRKVLTGIKMDTL